MTYGKTFYGKKKKKKKHVKCFTFFKSVTHFTKKMAWFSVDQENIFRWLLIFRETNTRKCWKHFSVSYFQWNKRTLNVCCLLTHKFQSWYFIQLIEPTIEGLNLWFSIIFCSFIVRYPSLFLVSSLIQLSLLYWNVYIPLLHVLWYFDQYPIGRYISSSWFLWSIQWESTQSKSMSLLSAAYSFRQLAPSSNPQRYIQHEDTSWPSR